MSRTKKQQAVLDKYYERVHAKQVLGVIFQGTMHNPRNIQKWLDKFFDDKRRGKIK